MQKADLMRSPLFEDPRKKKTTMTKSSDSTSSSTVPSSILVGHDQGKFRKGHKKNPWVIKVDPNNAFAHFFFYVQKVDKCVA